MIINATRFSYKMKLIESVYILALVVCFAGNCACISSGTSVASSTDIKYQAAVLCPVIMCSGAIVSSKNVLTTATCVYNLLPGDVEVHVGSNKYYDGGFLHNVANIIIHHAFTPSTYDYNIAVLTMVTSFDYSTGTVQPIPLATAVPQTDTYLTATAFGAINPSMELPDVLQKVYLKKYSATDCQTYKKGRITATMFCAGDITGNKDLCPEDQGAPFVYQSNLVGLYSWGCSCGLANPHPSSPVFTSITYLRNWIQSTIITS